MNHLFIIGLRGSGKSTVGKDLAHQMGKTYIDLDLYLMDREKMSISDIVAKYGWPYFRSLEKECLREACKSLKEDGIIATGGGVVLDKKNREYMRKNGNVIWLTAHPQVLCERLTENPDLAQRPSLSDKKLFEEMNNLGWERFPFYFESAHYIIDGEKESGEICAIIKDILNS